MTLTLHVQIMKPALFFMVPCIYFLPNSTLPGLEIRMSFQKKIYYFFYLKVRFTDREKERTSTCLFIVEIVTMANTGPSQSQDSETVSEFPMLRGKGSLGKKYLDPWAIFSAFLP